MLLTLGVEIVGRQPCLEVCADGGPFGVEDREPGGVAIVAFDDDVLVEGPFVGEAEPGGCIVLSP
jgi:hypothetical protein